MSSALNIASSELLQPPPQLQMPAITGDDDSNGSNINPFLFLQPYGLNDHYKLLGREEEAQSLLALQKWKEIVVVYWKTGVGKTNFKNKKK